VTPREYQAASRNRGRVVGRKITRSPRVMESQIPVRADIMEELLNNILNVYLKGNNTAISSVMDHCNTYLHDVNAEHNLPKVENKEMFNISSGTLDSTMRLLIGIYSGILGISISETTDHVAWLTQEVLGPKLGKKLVRKMGSTTEASLIENSLENSDYPIHNLEPEIQIKNNHEKSKKTIKEEIPEKENPEIHEKIGGKIPEKEIHEKNGGKIPEKEFHEKNGGKIPEKEIHEKNGGKIPEKENPEFGKNQMVVKFPEFPEFPDFRSNFVLSVPKLVEEKKKCK